MEKKTLLNNILKIRIFLFLTLNLILLSLIIEFQSEKLIVGFFLILTVLSIAVKNIIYSKMSFKDAKSKTQIRNYLSLVKKYMKITRKYFGLQLIGLILAIVLLSQTIIIPVNVKQETFEETINSSPSSAWEIQINNGFDSNSDLLYAYEEIVPIIEEQIRQTSSNYEFNIQNISQVVELALDSGDQQSTSSLRTKVKRWNFENFKKLMAYPSFNKSFAFNPNEITLLLPEPEFIYYNVTEISIGGIPILTWVNASTSLSTNFLVDKIEMLSIEDFVNFRNRESLSPLFDGTEQNFLFVPENREWELYDQVENSIPEGFDISQSKVHGGSDFRFYVFLELPNVVSLNPNKFKQQLQSVMSELNIWLINTLRYPGRNTQYVVSPLVDTIQLYLEQIDTIDSLIFLAIANLLSITVILSYISLTFIDKRKKEIVRLSKRKGMSLSKLNLLLTSEVVLSTIAASVIGVLLIRPSSYLFMNGSGEFDIAYNDLLILSEIFWKLPLFALILAIDFSYLNYRGLTKVDLISSNEFSDDESSIWRRYHLDIFVVLLLTILMTWLSLSSMFDRETGNFLRYKLNPVLLGITIILLPIVISKNFGVINSFILGPLSKLDKHISITVLHHLKVDIKSISRIVALATVCLILIVSANSTFDNYDKWGKEQSYYQVGSDIYLSGIDPTHKVWNSLAVEGVEAYSEIVQYKNRYNTQFGEFTFSILGINSTTFGDTAYWNANYGSSINSIINSLKDKPIAVATHQAVLDTLGFRIGANLLLQYSALGEYLLELVSEFEYFPRLVQEVPYEVESGIYEFSEIPLLAGYDLTRLLIANSTDSQGFASSYEYGAIVKVKPDYSVEQVAENLRRVIGVNKSITVQTVGDQYKEFRDQVNTKLYSLSVFIINILATTAFVISFLFYMIETYFNRQREFGILRTFGLQTKQILRIFTMELVFVIGWISLLSLILSIPISYLLVNTLIFWNAKAILPPIGVSIPSWLITIQFGALFFIGVIVILVLSYYFKDIEPGNVLRTE